MTRLTRLPSDGQIAGVCAGLAHYLGADVTLVRLAWVVLSIVPGGIIGGVLAYVAAWLLIPEAPSERLAPTGRRLQRAASNRRIGGVCGGLAEYFGVDATLVRLVTAVLAIYPGVIILGVLTYLMAWLVIPPAATVPDGPMTSHA